MWKWLSLSKLWDLLSTTHQSRKMFTGNCQWKECSAKTVACEGLKFNSCFSKKYPFSTSSSLWERRNPDFSACLAIQSRSTIYIYIYSVFYNMQFRICSKEDGDWQGMDWASCLFVLNKNIMLTAFGIPGIGKGKSFCYIMQTHCKCLFLVACHSLGSKSGKQMQIEKKEA